MTEIIQRPAVGFGEGAIEFVGLHDGVEAGHEVGLPFKVRVEGTEYAVFAGSDLKVAEPHRRSNLGMLLPEAMREAAPDGIAVAGAVSRMAQPVYEFLGFSDFQMPRYALPLHGRTHFGVWAGLAVVAYRMMLRAMVAVKTRGFSFAPVDSDDRDAIRAAAKLIATDAHPCCEVHDEAWLWRHLHEGFSGDPLTMTVIRKQDELVGVCLTKVRRKEKVRNLRDVRLGSVVEWQVGDEFKDLTGWFLVREALSLVGVADLVEISTGNEAIQRLLNQLHWRLAGACDFMIGVAEKSPLAGNKLIEKSENWRLRPAMGDNGLC